MRLKRPKRHFLIACCVVLLLTSLVQGSCFASEDSRLVLGLETFSDSELLEPCTDFTAGQTIWVKVTLSASRKVSDFGIEQLGFRVYYPVALANTTAGEKGEVIGADLDFSSNAISADSSGKSGLHGPAFSIYGKCKQLLDNAGLPVLDGAGNPSFTPTPLTQDGVLAKIRLTPTGAAAGRYVIGFSDVAGQTSLVINNGPDSTPGVKNLVPVSNHVSFSPTAVNITKRQLTVTAPTVTKYQGAADPALTYQVANLLSGDSQAQVFTGALARQAGEALGEYAILPGSLALTVDGARKYTFAFVLGKLRIIPVPAPDPGSGQPDLPTPPITPGPVVKDGKVNLPISGQVEQDAAGQPIGVSYLADEQTAAQIKRAKGQGATTVQLQLGLDAATTKTVKATVPANVLAAAAQGTPAALVMQTAAGSITLPPALVSTLATQNQPLVFTAERLAPAAVQEQLPVNTQAVADPLQIVTNLRGRTLVTMPVNIVLPADAGERAAMIASYSVFAQHSDGADESIAEIELEIDDSVSPPLLRGISFSVDRFSTFTLVQAVAAPAADVLTTRVGVGSYQFNDETHLMEPCYYLGSDTMMTLRMLEPFGVKFGWDAAKKQVTITYGERVVQLWVGSGTSQVNGLDTPILAASGKIIAPEIRHGRTSVPLRFVAEQLGFRVHWAAHLITIRP